MFAKWTVGHAWALCILSAGLYVGSMYVIPLRVRRLPRDNVVHIKYRLTSVSIATTLSVVIFAIVVPYRKYLNTTVLEALGLAPRHLFQSLFLTGFLMSVFYLGPLVSWLHFVWLSREATVLPSGVLVARSHIPSWTKYVTTEVIPNLLTEGKSVFSGSQLNIWSNIRALIVAPITEEIVFRSITVPSLYIALVAAPKIMLHVSSMAGLKNGIEYVDFAYTPWVVVCLNPLCFGLAHVHHLIEKLNSGANPVSAILSSLVQFTYTSIFGVIATLLLMRTNSVYAAILSHIVCNSVGLPDTSFMTKEGSRDASHYSVSTIFLFDSPVYFHIGG
eukprot:gene8482-10065_t